MLSKIPTENSVTITLVPPDESNGNGIPVTGMIPRFIPILIKILKKKVAKIKGCDQISTWKN